MKNKNNVLISTVIMSVSYVLMLIGATSIDKLFALLFISIIAYAIGIILSIVSVVKYEKLIDNPKVNTAITVMTLFSFFPLGLYLLWTKVKWNKIVKIFATILIPVVASTISILPLTANDDIEEQVATVENSITEATIEISTTEAPTTTEPTTQETTTEQTTVTTTKSQTTTTTTKATTTTQKETTTQKQSSGRTVYIAPTGKRYHYDKECCGPNAQEKDLDEVKTSHTPCKTCVH